MSKIWNIFPFKNQGRIEAFDGELTQLHPILSSFSSQKSDTSVTSHSKNHCRPDFLFYGFNRHVYLPESENLRDLALIWLFQVAFFLVPPAKFEKTGIFDGKKLAQSLLCMLNTFKITKSNLSDFLEQTGTSLRMPKEAWLSASECAVITCPQIGPSGFKLVLLGQFGLDLKLVRLWKTLGMAKLPGLRRRNLTVVIT